MSVPCETSVKTVAPAIRAVLAKKLLDEHDLNQEEAAKFLGISQAAISKYISKVRGKALDLDEIDEIQVWAEKVADELVSGKMSRTQLVSALCQACTLIRNKGILCPLCWQRDSTFKDCRNCLT
ncbi:transcriptional regulator [[Eubacterium] cellulosolvens]